MMPTYPNGYPETRGQMPPAIASLVGVWQGNGDKNDSSGNGYNLTKAAGSETYRRGILADRQCFFLDGATYYTVDVAALELEAGMSVGVLFLPLQMGSQQFLFSHSTAGETEAANILYSLQIAADNELVWLSESGAATDNYINTGFYITEGRPYYVIASRSSGDDVTIYVATPGSFIDLGTTNAAATGGTSGLLQIGGVGALYFSGFLANMWVANAELTALQAVAEARRVFPMIP